MNAKNFFRFVPLMIGVVSLSMTPCESWAQSGSRRAPSYRPPVRPSYRPPARPSRPYNPPQNYIPRRSPVTNPPQRVTPLSKDPSAPVAMKGYCPVCLLEKKQWTKGSSEIASTYDGHTYLFPDTGTKAIFDANPSRYVPALSGDSVVSLKDTGRRVPGDVRHGSLHNGRVYLFANAKEKEMFTKNVAAYANIDLALGGHCAVCQIDLGRNVLGNPKYTEIYNGKRYLFPNAKQMKAFRANPRKYSAASSPPSSGSGIPRANNTRGSGTR